jgi:PAS domain S-box-containing protein
MILFKKIKNLLKKPLNLSTATTHSLAFRFMSNIILWAILFVVITTVVQVFLDYRREIKSLDERFQQIKTIQLPSLSNSIWHFNEKQIEIELQGMLNLQDICYLELSVVDGKSYKIGQIIPLDDVLNQTFVLNYIQKEQTYNIGQLQVIANKKSLQERVLSRMLGILLTAAIQMFLLSGIIFFIAERMFTHPLHQIVRYTETLDFENLNLPLVIKKRWIASERDELGLVVLTFNKMRQRLWDYVQERRQSGEALRLSEIKFKELFDEAPVGYHEIDIQGRITRVNKTELEILGYTKDEMLNQYIWSFVAEKEVSQSSVDVKLTGLDKSNESYERTFKRKDGILIPVLVEDKLIKNTEGIIIGIRSTIQNISERKKYEIQLHESNIQLEQTLAELKETQKMVSQQERLRALGQLASGIAHDINNSLTPIMGYVDLLSDDKELMIRNAKSVNMILKSTKNIARTIGRLKEFYKIKLTDKDLEVININKIIDNTIELTKHKWKNIAESSGAIIEIKKEYDENLPLTRGDESELTEALTNFIINACDAMPNGGTLTFKTSRIENKIMINIIDTGYGMNEVVLKQCMNPFFTTKGEKGSGLGLAMAYGVIDRHKGEMKIDSILNKGTCISLSLPINNEILNVAAVDEGMNFTRSLNILCVDDDITINDMIKQIMERKGHKVMQANDGYKGLELYSKSFYQGVSFDLVITDLGMPGLDGSSLSKEIKKINPSIPIILLTGWGALINRDDYPAIDYLLSKPVMTKDLFIAINELFREK